jgi:hypothetical protein
MMYLTLSEDSRPNEERHWLVDIVEAEGTFGGTLDIGRDYQKTLAHLRAGEEPGSNNLTGWLCSRVSLH